MPSRRQLKYVVAASLWSVLVLGAAGASAAPGTVRHLNLTGVVKKPLSKSPGSVATFALESGQKAVGKVTRWSCQGAGLSLICGGHMRLKGFGSNLRLFAVTWTCHVKHGGGIACGSGKGAVDTPTKSLGSVTIKSGPGVFDKADRRFPLTMRLT